MTTQGAEGQRDKARRMEDEQPAPLLSKVADAPQAERTRGWGAQSISRSGRGVGVHLCGRSKGRGEGSWPFFGIQPEGKNSMTGRAFHHLEDSPALAGQHDRARGEMQMESALGALHHPNRNMPIFFFLGGILSGDHFRTPSCSIHSPR